jgi:hypothetical protein
MILATLDLAQERFARFAHRAKLRAHEASRPLTVMGRKSLGGVFGPGRQLARPIERHPRFLRGMSPPV